MSNICNTSKEQEDPVMQRTNKKNSVKYMVVDENTLNAEILWTLKVVKSHMLFRFCIDLSKLFLCNIPRQ